MLKVILLLHLFISFVNCFKQINKNIVFKNLNLKSTSNDYFQDLDLLHKFRSYFEKENYNDVIQDLANNKISKIFVDTSYKQLITVDNQVNDNYLYNHYHIVDINPVILPNLVEKTYELHVPLYFVNFTPDNIIILQNILMLIH